MALAAAWVAFPLLLLAVASGWGLLVEWAAGARLPAPLLPGLGLCALAAALTLTSATVPELALSATVCGALAGLALRALAPTARGAPREREWGAAAAALGAFALLAAPVVLSGAPAVSGYIRLDDTNTFLALGDRVLAHGRDTAGLAPSTYEATLYSYLEGGYPTGSTLPLVAAGRLGGFEPIWLWMPYLALLGAVLAVSIESLVRPLAREGRLRAGVAVLASCSALLLGYVLWGGVKEIWAAAMAALCAALVPWTLARLERARSGAALRALVPLSACIAGLVAALSPAGAVWAAPALAALPAGVALARGRGRLVPLVLGAVLALGVALAALIRQVAFVEGLASAPGRGEPDWLGNLLEPLRLAQVGGIWPARDFRVEAVSSAATALLLTAVAAGAAIALWRAVSARAWGLLAYAGVLLSALAVLVSSGWAWGEAKALAIASPVPLALAGAGAAWLLSGAGQARRAVGATLAVLLAVGVGWSYALAFQGTTLSPFERHDELARIGERFAGRGPALVPDFDTYAGRWFLRRLDAEVAGELRRRAVALADGTVLGKGESADIDRFALESLDPYRLLVVRRSPAASRPPSSFERVWSGDWHEVWERRGQRAPVAHLGLGNAVDPGAVPACSQVRRIARLAGPRGSVRAVPVPNAPAIGRFERAPAGWRLGVGGTLLPDGSGSGTARATVWAPRAGRYEIWLGGAFRGGARVQVDGVDVTRRRHELSYAGQWVPFGEAELSAGPHALSVRLDGGGPHPGVRGIDRFPIGPVALAPAGEIRRVIELPSGRAGALCGRRLDWIEAVG